MLEKLFKLIREMIEKKFFGRVTISFQSGKICNIKIEQDKKLEEL